jgi:hypothetical protein
MLVKLLSDLHLHGNDPFKYVDHGESVCVLAGDISEGMDGVYWAVRNIPNHIQVLYVPGNHEYYGQDYTFLNRQFMVHNMNGTNVKVMLNDSFAIDGVEFVCSTLWTDFDVYNNQPLHALAWDRGLNDSRYIRVDARPLSHQDFIKWNKQAMRYISDMAHQTRLAETVRVLVTHYCPEFSVAAQYRGDPLTPGFATKIPEHIHGAFDFHFHGHTHSSMDYELPYGTKVRCNPRGYRYEGGDFNEELVLDL